jgi:hypothetical protein
MSEPPENGWWPDEAEATMVQKLLRNGTCVAQIVRSGMGWRSYSLIELNPSKTGGKPLRDCSVPTRKEAQAECEDYVRGITK